ncbi:unnamed protein product [Kluyveromyces dobzhanskii CBS 2104]|uniref:WGS project CCBQ000000000 data, contig 00058 n=1 Tax=Kluyveromyces dobzhanskii CBS 2104 TaxID=1427455 RepID=A0A0A8LDJ6_9SACH|nr:unnamed protein product [Kluyveromyces dobzhanskii CBS 2104]
MRAEKLLVMVNIWINEFILWSVMREDIQIIYEGENINSSDRNLIIISNHRSIVDYFLIQSQFGADNVIFASWTRLMKYPSLKHFWTIFRHDENASVSACKLKRFYGPENLVLFPEVNVFTPEVKFIERKLMKLKYKGLPILHNVLYPRFKTFVNLIQAFSNSSNRKWCRVLEYLILPTEAITRDSTKLLDLTLVYYTIKLNDFGEYKLEQTTPALWDVWSLETPLFLCIHASYHDFEKLSKKKPKQLESWLENQWSLKDKLIDTFELNVEVV